MLRLHWRNRQCGAKSGKGAKAFVVALVIFTTMKKNHFVNFSCNELKNFVQSYFASVFKNNLILSLLLSMPSLLSGQINSFAPVGSTWYYDHTYFFGNNQVDFLKIQTLSDTVIDGKLCTIVYLNNANVLASSFPDSIYLYYNSGKVYRYFPDENIFGLQYDFNAQAGDTLTCYGSVVNFVFDSFLVRVDSVGLIQINGFNLITQYYNRIAGSWDYSQRVIEGIGGEYFLFPAYTLSENTNFGLRCYDDSVIGFFNTGLVSSCDTIFYSGINSQPQNGDILISPTLIDRVCTFTNLSSTSISVSILNISGDLKESFLILPKEKKQIDCTFLNDGYYIAQISSQNLFIAKKLIKISSF